MNDCENLDAFLISELMPDESARFAAHLDGCPSCREAVDEQQWIDGLLRAPAIAQLEAPPAALAESFRGALARRILFRRFGAGVAAAAVLLIAVGGMVLSRQADRARLGDVAVSGTVAENAEAPAATFVAGSDVIAVPVASPHPDVTIVRVYPAYEPDYSIQASLDPTTAGDELAWPDLNGG